MTSAKMRATTSFALIACLTWLIGCSAAQDQASAPGGLSGRLTLSGSSTVAPLAGEIGKRFEALHPGVRVDVQSGGSARGIADARRGTADIGMASRALKPEESDLAGHAIALDGISLIVHRDNPVAELTAAQVVGIYTGTIGNWSAVGGNDAPITVVNKADGRSTLELFLAHFGLAAEAIRPSVVIGDNQQGVLTVAGDPDAIGYVSIGSAQYEVDSGRAIRLLPMDGIAPSVESVRDGSFPLSRQLTLVTLGAPSPLETAFIEFARSRPMRDVVEAQHFVPVSQ
ncbi:MAG: phosphate ABC transporter substrate-binding protein [Pseudomonadota bacterium]|nr:phosphate ABC transporter substrate-binding protein [Pseudomonadota bacterium]